MSSTASVASQEIKDPAEDTPLHDSDSSGGGESKLSTPPVLMNFTKKPDGIVIPSVQIQLIFWGTTWDDVSVRTIKDAVLKILEGPYMSGLKQYGNLGPNNLAGLEIVKSKVQGSPENPPNSFAEENIQGLIRNLIQANRIPQPDNPKLFYCVLLPPDVTGDPDEFFGKHFFFRFLGHNVHYAWVISGPLTDNGHKTTTARFSHELVETVTDPEGTGFQSTGCTQRGWCEIADLTHDTAVTNGVTVQKYFSQVDQTFIAPGESKGTLP